MKYFIILTIFSLNTLLANETCPCCDKTKEFIDFSLDDLYQMRKMELDHHYFIEDLMYIDGRISAFQQVKHLMIE